VRGIGNATIKKVEEFVEAGDPFEIELTARTLDEIRHGIKQGWRDYRGLPRPTHVSHTIPRDRDCNVVWMGVVRNIEYKDLIEDERARSGESVEEIRARVKDPDLVKSCTLHCYDDGDDDVYVRINRWKFPKFQKIVETILPRESVVIVSGRKRASFGVSLQVQSLIVMTPEDDEEEDDE
jgi:DNA polymerase-3 subunit alpha